jgi:hypothetical protein
MKTREPRPVTSVCWRCKNCCMACSRGGRLILADLQPITWSTAMRKLSAFPFLVAAEGCSRISAQSGDTFLLNSQTPRRSPASLQFKTRKIHPQRARSSQRKPERQVTA